MKVAVIGTGKTGGEVCRLVPKKDLVGPFNTSNPPTLEGLKEADVIIVFVPGHAVDALVDLLIETGKPVVIGSTGFEWREGIQKELKANRLTWVIGENFSLGMTVVRHLIKRLAQLQSILHHPTFHIHEKHHIHKKDAPSGTALAWKRWLYLPEAKGVAITSERKDDIVGIHQLSVKTSNEIIKIEHEAQDRSLFAEGALWAGQQLVGKQFNEYGLYRFEEFTDRLIGEVLV